MNALSSHPTPEYILTLSCPDRPGIVHAITGLLLQHQGNITEAAQYNATDTGHFFMRVRFASPAPHQTLCTAVRELAPTFGLNWRLAESHRRMPTVILVSKLGHCLNDLLFRTRTGTLPIDIRAVISNHEDFRAQVENEGIPFHHVPVSAATRDTAEKRQLDIIEQSGAELIVLARYMQILSDSLCRQLEGRAINIHHSFLPSFKGARPYYQAHDRGVKIIGATAHYVTAELDEGPIIEQDIERVDHAMNVETLTALGGDVENVVLARAVKWHAEHRIMLDGHRTVVFR
ncbi:formyltetrahydrofolate deformylase [Lautropia dentalis]|uniref:Formyltetrahydrofolate deformylase n=1 Tax=Lautropia dentalis TaxID=2490857 RepID=A0A426FQY4_9BURK|nr:formyltetrahydrofolate deformylase [Lautropia dentalis]RRN45070.1 formyltetrahydrofolate deformylase [Lautropia dentalis]